MPSRTAFLFPGQGRVLNTLPSNIDQFDPLLELAQNAELHLREWVAEGQVDRLASTDAAQPLMLLDSLCREKLLSSAGWHAECVAGHSLGEYAALVASGVLQARDAMHAVIERGRLMNSVQGTMAAILKLDLDTIRGLCAGTAAVVANHNAPGQVVVSGPEADVQAVVAQAESHGGRGIPLKVSGPFHSPLMQPAQDTLAILLCTLSFSSPHTPIISSVSGRVEHETEILRALLTRQMTAMVRWVDVSDTLAHLKIDTAIEVGAGDVLTRLGRRSGSSIRYLTFEEAMRERL